MKRTSRIAAAIMSFALSAAMLTACSEEEPTAVGLNKNQVTSSQETTVTTPDDEDLTTTTELTEPPETTTTTTTTQETTTTTTTSQTTTTEQTTTTTAEQTTTKASQSTTAASTVKGGVTTTVKAGTFDSAVNSTLYTTFINEYNARLAVAKQYSWYIHNTKVMKNTADEYSVYVCYAIKKSSINITVLPGMYKTVIVNGAPKTTFYQVTGVKNQTIADYDKYTVARQSSQMDTVFKSYGKQVKTT